MRKSVKLNKLIRRSTVYDIETLHLTHSVGSSVVASVLVSVDVFGDVIPVNVNETVFL